MIGLALPPQPPVFLALAANAIAGYAWLLAIVVLLLLRLVYQAGILAKPVRWPSMLKRRRFRLRILGVHPVPLTEPLFAETLAIQWGEDLIGEARRRAEDEVRSYFDGLFLIEVELEPPAVDLDWGEVTQEIPGVPSESWQVPYGEQRLDGSGRWAFYFHFLDLDKPLLTPAGPITLPPPSSMPERLQRMEYHAP
jgi:hypothetical protein